MKMSAPFESSLSQRAQFQVLTLVVWVSFLVLLVVGVAGWKLDHHVGRTFVLPLFHLLPWAFGSFERSRLMKEHGTRKLPLLPDSSPEREGLLSVQSLLRVLWSAYSSLFLVESIVFWG